MGSLAAVAKALARAERRIITRLRKEVKKLREKVIKDALNGSLKPWYDIDKFAEALRFGMLSAYIYGRASVKGIIKQSLESRLQDVKLQEVEEEWVDVFIHKLLITDKGIISSLVGKKVDPFEFVFHPSKEALNFLDDYTVKLAGIFEEAVLKKTTSLVRDTIEQGMSEREAVRYLSKNLKQFTNNRIKMIARTEATRAFNIGTLEESFSSEIIVGYKFDAVLDDRTTKKICRPRNGMFIPKSDVDLLIKNTPPLHVNCRSRLVPVTKYDEIPKKIMPVSFPPELTPKHRSYDLQKLQELFGSRKARIDQKPLFDINDVVRRIKDVPIKEKYTARELKEVYKLIDPEYSEYNLPKVRSKKLPKSIAGLYDPLTDTIEIDWSKGDFKTFIHESFHRMYYKRAGGFYEGDFEEAVVDFLAKHVYSRAYPGKIWKGGYVQEPLKPMLYIYQLAKFSGKSIKVVFDRFAEKLFEIRLRKKDVFDDEEVGKAFLEGVKLTEGDIETIREIVKKKQKKFKEALRKFYKVHGWRLTDEDLKRFINLIESHMFKTAIEAKTYEALGILQAVQFLLLNW